MNCLSALGDDVRTSLMAAESIPSPRYAMALRIAA